MLRPAAVLCAFISMAGCTRPNPVYGGSDGEGSSGGVESGATTGAEVPTSGSSTGGAPVEGCPDHPWLAACYEFPADEVAVFVDGSGQGHDGALTQITLEDGMEGYGKAGSFTAGSHAAIAEDPAFDSPRMTISMLIRPSGPGVLIDNDNQLRISYEGEGDLICLVVNQETKDAASVKVPGVPRDTWSQVSCSFDGAAVKLTIRAMNGFERTKSTPFAGTFNPDGVLGSVIGAQNPELTDPFMGLIDHVLFFDDALSDADLCRLDPFCG